jgi:hypothetical protein
VALARGTAAPPRATAAATEATTTRWREALGKKRTGIAFVCSGK